MNQRKFDGPFDPGHCRSDSRRGGFALTEVMISLGILTLSIGGLLGAVHSSSTERSNRQETALAVQAVRQTIEQIQGSGAFSEVFARFNADPADNPEPASPGNVFAVRGLAAQHNDADGVVGEILFPMIGDELREDVNIPSFGGQRDLNADGVIDDLDHSDDYLVLPVTIRVSWTSSGGDRSFDASLCLFRW